MLRKILFFLCLSFLALPSFAEEVAGNPQGTTVLIEFFDYQCPHCRNMTNIVENLIKKNPDLRVVYYVLPVLGDDSWFAAKAALAARYQGKLANFHQLLMYQTEPLSQSILSLAEQDGLNVQQLRTDMEKPKITKELQQNFRLAKTMKVTGVPTFLIESANAKTFRFDGEVSLEKLQDAITKSQS